MIFEKKIELEDVTGTISIEIPKYKERLAIIKAMNIDLGNDGNVSIGSDQLALADKMADEVLPRIKKVDLKTVHGDKINTIDELEYYSVYAEIVNSLISVVFSGAKLGKLKRKHKKPGDFVFQRWKSCI